MKSASLIALYTGPLPDNVPGYEATSTSEIMKKVGGGRPGS